MSEYDLVCDVCGKTVAPDDGVLSWTTRGRAESAHAITHVACEPASATDRVELRMLVWPNGFLRFVTERYAREVADPDALGAIVWALAPFVMRHDNAAEMDGMRAASFGAIPGVKPGSSEKPAPVGAAHEVESGK